MEEILRHIARITSPRDHEQVDVETMQALDHLLGVKEVRLYDLYRHKGQMLVRQRLFIRDAGIEHPPTSQADPDKTGEPLDQFPVLRQCVDQRTAAGHDVAADGSCILWLPVWVDDNVHCCFSLQSAEPFGLQEMTLIHGLLDVYANYQSLLDYSQRDSLTGLLNRKTFDEDFSRMTSAPASSLAEQDSRLPSERRHATQAREHWLAVVDIDHFKKVNDEFGHLYGDEVLILVANILRASFRAHDRVFRFGGEEFVIILRSVVQEEAQRIFERFRAKVEEHSFPQVGRVTVSVGYAHVVNDTPVVILGHADQALYFAKDHGRNQVCYYDDLVKRGDVKSQVTNESVEFFFDDQPEEAR